jgi:hypothetical protein
VFRVLLKFPFIIVYLIISVFFTGIFFLNEGVGLYNSNVLSVFIQGCGGVIIGIVLCQFLMSKIHLRGLSKGGCGKWYNQYRFFMLLTGITIVVLTIIFFAFYGAPIFSDNSYVARVNIGSLPFSNFVLRTSTFALPLIGLSMLAHYLVCGDKKSQKYAVFILIASVAFRFLLGNKGGGAELMLLVLFFLSFYRRIDYKYFFYTFSFSLSIIVYVGTLHAGVGLYDSLALITDRLFTSSVYGAYVLIDEYSGRGLEVESVSSFGKYLLEWKFGEQEAPFSLTITMPALIYALFGYDYLLLLSIASGFIYALLFNYSLFKSNNTVISPILITSLFYLVFVFIRGSVLDMLVWQYLTIFLTGLYMFSLKLFVQNVLSESR